MSQPLPDTSSFVSRVPRIAEEAVRRARLSVVPRRIAEAPRVPFIALMTFVMVAGVVGLLMFNTSMQQASFAASSLEEQASALTSRQESLRSELEDLRDPQRVAESAQRLGMVPAAGAAFLELDSGKVIGVPTAATPADAVRLNPPAPRLPSVYRPDPIVQTVVATPEAATADQAAGEADQPKAGHKNKNRNKLKNKLRD